MKIAYLNHTFPPMVTGVSHAVHHLAAGMAGRGHSVLVVVASDQGAPYTTMHPNLRVMRLRSYPNPMARELRFMLWPQSKITSILEDFAPDIVHIHDPLLATLVRMGYIKAHRVPTIFTAHIHPQVLSYYSPHAAVFNPVIEKMAEAYCKWLLQQADALVMPSRTIDRYLSRLTQRPAHVISNGIDLAKFHPLSLHAGEERCLRKKYDLDPHAAVILHVGRMSKEKNVAGIVRASAAAMKGNSAQLLIVGDGPERQKIKNLCGQLGVGARTSFPGFVAHNGDLPGLYRMASVFVTASEFEAQGLVLLEAAACGTPIVAVNSGAAPELVLDEINGYLVRPGEIERMADRIQELLVPSEKASTMGQRSRALAEKHAHQATFEEHERLYQQTITSMGRLTQATNNRIPILMGSVRKGVSGIFKRAFAWL